MPPTRGSLRTIGVTATLAMLVPSVHAQGPLARAESLPGAWETTTPDGGVHGLWIEINTSQLKKKETTTQGITTEIYHRQGGQQTGASTREKNGGSFDVMSPRLRSEAMDLTFDAAKRWWTGSWFLNGDTRQVILDRPACPSSPLCGTWEGRDPLGAVRMHVAQSSDGLVTAWMDRTSDPANQQHGQRLRVVSSDPQSVTVETLSAVCCTNRFVGHLSEDGQRLSGKWSSLNIKVDTQQVFRRMLSIRREAIR